MRRVHPRQRGGVWLLLTLNFVRTGEKAGMVTSGDAALRRVGGGVEEIVSALLLLLPLLKEVGAVVVDDDEVPFVCCRRPPLLLLFDLELMGGFGVDGTKCTECTECTRVSEEVGRGATLLLRLKKRNGCV